MRTQLNDDEIRSFREHGFLVVPDLFDPDELDEWRAAVDAAVDERVNMPLPGITGAEDPDVLATLDEETQEAVRFTRSVFTQRVNLWQTNDRMRELVVSPALGRIAADLAGVDRIRLWHDQALIKERYSAPTAFHLDVPIWSFTTTQSLSIWIALDDATLENGCLYYVPGSHKAEIFDIVPIGPELGGLFEAYPEWRDVAPVACPVRAGGALFHNGLTFHGAGANMTPGRRRAMTAGFMPDGCTYNGKPNILPADYLATLQVGDLLDNDAQNPLLFSRS